MNNVFLIGRFTKDPELRFTQGNGTAVTRFTIAINRNVKDSDKADFINCVAFGKTAENIATYMLKGKQIAIEGRIQTSSYEKEGAKRYITEVVVNRSEFLSYGKEVGEKEKAANIDNDLTPVDDGDMPF